MTKRFTPILAILSLSVLAGCGGDGAEGTGSSSGDSVIWTQSVEEYAARADVRCDEGPEVCGLAVGQLYSRKSPTQLSVCTAFLIAPDLALTNSHCLPQSLQPGHSCRGAVVLKFPSSAGFPAESMPCATVIDRAGGTAVGRQDYALLQLATTVRGRTPLVASVSGVSEWERVTVLRITPHGAHQPGGAMSRLSCPVVRTTQFSPRHGRRANDLEFMADCPVTRGNSGSPVINGRGAAVGIISEETSPLEGSVVTANEHGAVMTSLACMPLPGSPRRLPRSCGN